ncbi:MULTISPECIES: S-layer homology domain-containing protein [Brevibacillus]|uniref:S-layer homology domain-containing protein n=1 Tax=Brevibacillus TaxID=55080 RepID=UPI00046AC0B1|nr:S-layer homology domain-containing protein [Brevibacillus borstelensis]MCC0566888.1 S-layer homology domain-containing protein [Brevibacillus borstelensis]MCM3593447.1 S-layer homology domain-containing protein [Brevibacillus borstelensis]MED2011256.1 S-layer homology domain-containing protein [Brevibacillus borstelensis]WNF03448.1 S-layer homology domain-containing protein [Brevibacillus borstelensis]
MHHFKVLSTKTVKKGLAGAVMAGLLAVSNTGLAATALPLSDIASNAYKGAILKLNYAGVLKGYTDGTFKPEKEVTRAEFAKIAVLAMGYTDEQAKLMQGKTAFKDLPADHWATGYINLAVSQGIIKGYPDGTFKPNNTVKVAEALTVYVQGLKISVPASTTGQWYYPYLLEANKAGIYDSKDEPTAAARRDVVAKFTDFFMETPVYANGAYYDKNGNAKGTVQKLPVVKGTVDSYDKSTKKLKLTGQKTEVTIADNAQVFGSIVAGAKVEYIVKNGKIAFLNVVTADTNIVEGIVKTGLNFSSAVGDEKQFKAIVNGKEIILEVESGVTVSRSHIGKKFVAVMDEDGKVASITISDNATSGLVKKTSTVSGTKAKKEIQVGDQTYELTANAVIKGKTHPLAKEATGSFADIAKGDLVELTLDVDGKASAVTYTKLSTTQTIKVDADDNVISFDGYEYEVLQDTKLYVDEDKVSELDDLKNNSVAVLTFDQDGNLIKVEQGVGVSEGKLVDDTTAYEGQTKLATIKVDGKTYDILANAKLTIDGNSVSATTIKADQLNDYRIVSWKYNLGTNDIVELTAEKQTVVGYVTEKSGKTITVNGKDYELLSGVSIDDNADTNDKEYTLVLNNDGKVKAVTGAAKTLSGVVDSVEVVNENGSTKSAEIEVNGKTYKVLNADTVDDVDQFELVTLTMNREGEVTKAVVQGTLTKEEEKFIGIEARVNGDKYVFFNNVSTSIKLSKDAKVKYYDGSDMDEDEVKSSDKVDLWTNADGQVYLIVVNKR